MSIKITLIGAGNVGTHLGKRLYKKGFSINQVYSRNRENAKELAVAINAKPIDDLNVINSKSDIYIIAVKDDAIELVAQQLSANPTLKNKLVVHTSGAASSQLLAKHFKNYGIFYPLQTFSKNKKVSFKNIPICIDAPNKKDLKFIKKIGKRISNKVSVVNDTERAILHVAAVIVNNFTNHLFHLGQTIVEQENISFDLLKPLIEETVRKIEKNAPLEMQTGPARRGDQKTLKKHLTYLQKFPEYAHLYVFLTKSIQDAYRR